MKIVAIKDGQPFIMEIKGDVQTFRTPADIPERKTLTVTPQPCRYCQTVTNSQNHCANCGAPK